MNIQELSDLWSNSNPVGTETVTINRKLLKEVTIQKVKSMLGGLKWGWIIELFINAFFLQFLVKFISAQYMFIEFLIPALIVLVVNMASLIICMYKIKIYSELSPQSPVLDTQLKLARLKYLETWEANSLLVVIPVYAAPIIIVLAEGLLGFNLYLLGDWVFNYTMGSIVVGVIVVIMIKMFPNQKLENAIALFRDIKDIHNEKP